MTMRDLYKNYIPLAADLGTESSMGSFGKKGSNGIVNIGSVIEHINKTGDTHDIKKPLQTIAINTRRILNASNKNLAGRAFFDRVEQYDRLGAIAERVPVEEMRNGDNTVFIKRNGEEVAYEMQDGDTLTFSVKRNINESDYVLQKTSKSNKVVFQHADTKDLQPGNYVYDIQVQTALGQVQTIGPAKYVIQADITRQ